MGYCPWGPKELDMTERLTLSLFLGTKILQTSWPKPNQPTKQRNKHKEEMELNMALV